MLCVKISGTHITRPQKRLDFEKANDDRRTIIYFGRKVIFLDELPWMDAPRSGFLSELESFWNEWSSARVSLLGTPAYNTWCSLAFERGGIASTVRVETNERKSSLGNCETLDQDGVLRVF